MTRKDYVVITGALHRAGMIPDKNKIRQEAREKMRMLIASNLIGELKHENPRFDENKFLKACGLIY